MKATFIHHSAIVEDAVVVGPGTQVWDHAHLRGGAVVGSGCIIGGKTYIAGDVHIGDHCKINAGVYLCAGVSVGDGVMIAAHATFTNDIYPRACVNDLSALRPSEVDEHTTYTTVEDGVTVGANATIGSDLVLGRFGVVGMGAVVTGSVTPYTLVLGVPGRPAALVCRCGRPLVSLLDGAPADGEYLCRACDLRYGVKAGRVVEDPLDQEPRRLAKAGQAERTVGE